MNSHLTNVNYKMGNGNKIYEKKNIIDYSNIQIEEKSYIYYKFT